MSFAIPPNVIKRIASFISGRTHAVSSDRKPTCWLPIMQSIVKGSGVGPFLYISFASDIKLLSQQNQLCKYADNTTLIIPQHTNFIVEEEINHV
jgi:hypothetical protein